MGSNTEELPDIPDFLQEEAGQNDGTLLPVVSKSEDTDQTIVWIMFDGDNGEGASEAVRIEDVTDTEIDSLARAALLDAGIEVSDLLAKVLASEYHGGQSSALYSFASTGAIRSDLISEIEDAKRLTSTNAQLKALEGLQSYVEAAIGEPSDEDDPPRFARDPVDGWSRLSW